MQSDHLETSKGAGLQSSIWAVCCQKARCGNKTIKTSRLYLAFTLQQTGFTSFASHLTKLRALTPLLSPLPRT